MKPGELTLQPNPNNFNYRKILDTKEHIYFLVTYSHARHKQHGVLVRIILISTNITKINSVQLLSGILE